MWNLIVKVGVGDGSYRVQRPSLFRYFSSMLHTYLRFNVLLLSEGKAGQDR
jgi:hypothetical protein